MENIKNRYCFTTKTMRKAGYYGNFDFCVHPNNSMAYILDTKKDCFVAIDLVDNHSFVELKIERFYQIEMAENEWCGGLRCIQVDLRTFILAPLREGSTKKYYIMVYELKNEEGMAKLIEEHYLDVNTIGLNSHVRSVNDENDNLYFVESWIENPAGRIAEQKTIISVVELKFDHSQKIVHNVLIRNLTVNNYCFQLPFIYHDSIGFLIDEKCGPFQHIVLINLKNKRIQKRYSAIASDMHFPDRYGDGQYPPPGTYSYPSFQHGRPGMVYTYIFSEEKKSGQIWALNLNSFEWQKCFELDAHALKFPINIIVRKPNQLFLHGNCADEHCCERAHVYHFGVLFLDKTIFLNIEQTAALLSKSKTKILFGPAGSGKSLVVLLEAIKYFTSVPENDKIKIFVSTKEQRNVFAQTFSAIFGTLFNSRNITGILFDEKNIEEEALSEKNIFVDGLCTLSFKLKRILLQRPAGMTIITVDGEFPFGYDHPRQENVTWHRFQLTAEKNSDIPVDELAQRNVGQHNRNISSWQQLQSRMKNNEYIKKDKSLQHEQNLEQLIKKNMDVMDQLHNGWWSHSTAKQTICIPPCNDVFKNQCFEPTHHEAAGFDFITQIANDDRRRGQNAERDFLAAFQTCQFGGILISEFDIMEFIKCTNLQSLFRNTPIKQFEIDAIYIHPLIGIFVFEIKATEKQKYFAAQKNKALQQLNIIKDYLPVIFQKLTMVECALPPIHYAVCFSNIKICDDEKKRDDVIFIDKFSLHDKTKLLELLIQVKVDLSNENTSMEESLMMFTAAVAGYRSLGFISPGYNALVIHRMLVEDLVFQPPNRRFLQSGIFFTSDQLAILNCGARHQLISGPPGTGKTLILLRKALEAAMTHKRGRVHVITPRPELIFKFQKFFDEHRVVRLPKIDYGYNTLSSYDPDDDVFADEQYLNYLEIDGLRQRLQQINGCGQTVMVLTGLFNPLEIKNVGNFLNMHKLTEFRHFEMKTVFRSSSAIFKIWKSRFDEIKCPLYLGHNIMGPTVQRESLINSEKILNRVLELVREIFHLEKNLGVCKDISLGNLCIITDIEESCSLIKSFLSSNFIQCGSIEEQINNKNIAAVSKYDKIASHEWPIVIVVSFIDIAYPRQFFLLAVSRCITKLVIIERVFLEATKKIDQKILPLLKLSCNYLELKNVVESAEKENGETEQFVIHCYFIFQLIRWNILFEKLSRTKIFANCFLLYDCWQRIAERPTLFRIWLNQNEELREDLLDSMKIVPLTEKPAEIFTHIITNNALNTANSDSAWDALKRIEAVIIDIMEKEEKLKKEKEENTEKNWKKIKYWQQKYQMLLKYWEQNEMNELLNELNEADEEWKFIKSTIYLLME